MAKKQQQQFTVVLHGKWGGTRTVTIGARDAESARRVVMTQHRRGYERTGNVYPKEIQL